MKKSDEKKKARSNSTEKASPKQGEKANPSKGGKGLPVATPNSHKGDGQAQYIEPGSRDEDKAPGESPKQSYAV